MSKLKDSGGAMRGVAGPRMGTAATVQDCRTGLIAPLEDVICTLRAELAEARLTIEVDQTRLAAMAGEIEALRLTLATVRGVAMQLNRARSMYVAVEQYNQGQRAAAGEIIAILDAKGPTDESL